MATGEEPAKTAGHTSTAAANAPAAVYQYITCTWAVEQKVMVVRPAAAAARQASKVEPPPITIDLTVTDTEAEAATAELAAVTTVDDVATQAPGSAPAHKDDETCVICYTFYAGVYDKYHNRHWYTFHCDHRVCWDCLPQMLGSGSGEAQEVKCPVCREPAWVYLYEAARRRRQNVKLHMEGSGGGEIGSGSGTSMDSAAATKEPQMAPLPDVVDMSSDPEEQTQDYKKYFFSWFIHGDVAEHTRSPEIYTCFYKAWYNNRFRRSHRRNREVYRNVPTSGPRLQESLDFYTWFHEQDPSVDGSTADFLNRFSSSRPRPTTGGNVPHPEARLMQGASLPQPAYRTRRNASVRTRRRGSASSSRGSPNIVCYGHRWQRKRHAASRGKEGQGK